MWSEALSMLDRAERMQRQFFTLQLRPTSYGAVAWEPPVDVVESGDALLVQVALPGVPADAITVGLDPSGVSISAVRPFPCRGDASIHRVEIPYGRFERTLSLPLGDPYAPLVLVEKRLEDGVLSLVFRRKEGA